MSSETPSPLLLDAVKASASKFKETKSALDVREKELQALDTRLQSERADLDKQSAKLKADRETFAKEREEVGTARAAIERDEMNLKEDRTKVAAEEKRLQDWARTLNDREKSIKDGEDRIKRLELEISGEIKDSEVKLQALVEREELVAQRERSLAETIDRIGSMERGLAQRERSLAKKEEDLIRLQNERLNALEAREKELLKITEEMHARQRDSIAQHESFGDLQATLKQELMNIASEREKLALKEKSLIEAEKYLVAALEASGIDVPPDALSSNPPPPAPTPPPSSHVAPPPPTPTPVPRPPDSERGAEIPDDEDFAAVIEAKPKISKQEALERMTKALETAKAARDQGRNVSEIRKALKLARGAFESGDYDNAARLASEILRELESVLSSR